MELGYTKKCNTNFDDTVKKIEDLSLQKGFRVLHIHDVQATLADKGFEREPYKIIEICNGKFAYNALNITEDVGVFMPCKINVYTKNNKTIASAMKPSIISDYFDQKDLKDLALEIDNIVRSIIDEI